MFLAGRKDLDFLPSIIVESKLCSYVPLPSGRIPREIKTIHICWKIEKRACYEQNECVYMCMCV